MEWFESIKYIRTAQDNNRLVIFVGAGVSKNSGLPSWADLINAIATEIGYHHDDSCNDCEKRSKDCPKVQCGVQQFFTQDEFLRIPEYYYQSHSEDNHKEYYKFIQEKLQSEQKSNPIDNVIFNLLPHHIITTNYDSLLESSENSFTNLYQVISEDKDLLSKPNDRYIIKMHGDLDSPESIVLKESDYIEYEHKHPLISTFIRALLVNHTFLFLGYSLNDYNLNLIIGWINYFQNRYGVEDRPKSFLIVNKTPSVHERLRQKSKNIYIIDLSHFPEAVLKKVDVPQSLSNAIGKNLYAYLHALYEPKILESFIPLEKVLEEKYIALNSYNRISQYDFIHTLRLGRTFFASTELVFYDEDWYDRVEAIIHSGNSGITNYFHKAGITAIHSFQSDSVCLISSQDVCKDVLFEQYLENDYLLLQKTLETDNNASRKIYYYHLLANTTIDMNQLIDQMYLELSPSDYVSVLLSKMRERLAKLSIFDRQETLTREIEHLFATAPEKYRNSIGYLKMLFESSSKLILEMQSLLEKQEKRNKYGRNGWESGHAFTHIWKLQAMAYDYYFFFKCNYLPLDYFSDVNSFLCYYLQAILCSYTPVATEESDSVFGITTDHKRYPLNDIDLDMITKYVDTKTLKDWMKKYYVHSIEVLDSGTAIVSKYNHLCESFVHIGNAKWVSCIMNFTIIISISEIDDLVKIKAFDTFIFNYEKASKCSVKKCELLFETLYFLLNSNETYLSGEFKKQAIAVLLKDDVYRTIIEHNSYKLGRILRNYASFLDDENRRRQITYIGKQQELKTKIKEIYNRRFLLPKEEFRPILIENVCLLNIEELFNLLVEKYIPFSKIIQDIFVNAIKIEDEKRKTMPGVRTFPDHLIATIDDCIILKLCNIDFDVSLLVPYAEYSLPLQFMLDPEQFDYSQINTDHYMWQNLIYSKEYKRHFLKHKKEILSPKLNEIFKMGLSTVEQQKIVYGVLLGDDELRDY